MTQAKTARWLDLIAFLLGHRFAVTREQVFAKVRDYQGDPESARRKFERDKDELRRLGIEIESVPLPDTAGDEPATGYRLRPQSFYLPYLELADQPTPAGERPYSGLRRVTLTRRELAALDRATRRLAQRTEFPLAEAAASARRKLAFDVPLELRTAELVLATPLPSGGRQTLAVLQQAVAERNAVRCRYYSIGRDTEDDREVEPWGLFFQWSHWYCVGRARERDALRVFRVDRMREAEMLAGAGAEFEVPAAFDVRHYLGRAPWELGEGAAVAVRVRFEFPESRQAMHRGWARVVAEDRTGAELEFAVREPGSFLRWILSWRGRARVIRPPELARALDDLRREVARLYQEPPA